MEKLRKVRDLLKKFKEDDLSPAEAGELSALLEKGDKNDDLRNELEEIWQDPAIVENDIPTTRMLARLKKHLQVGEDNIPSRKMTIVSFIRPVMKYAAIVICTAGLTLILKDIASRNKFIDLPNKGAESFNEISVPFGSKTRVVLPDGSVVNLNSGSSLKYPARMDSTLRYAYIDGEAFFDIRKDPKHPFIVKTKEISIKVLGTKFNVKSYNDEKTVETTLVSGRIEIFSRPGVKSASTGTLVMRPNQQAIYKRESGIIDISEIPGTQLKKDLKPAKPTLQKIDVNTVIAWKDNRLLFRDESFADLTRRLERWYDVDIEIQDKDVARTLLSGIFERETIEQALEALKLATPFEYKMIKNKIIISK